MAKKLNYAVIQEILQTSKPLTLRTFAYTPKVHQEIDQVLSFILRYLNLERLKPQFSYCVHQLADQTQEINVKRIFFQEKGLNIADPDEYMKGSEQFRAEPKKEFKRYINAQKEKNIYMKIQFRTEDDRFDIILRSNCLLSDLEKQIILSSAELASGHTSLDKTLKELNEEPLTLQTGFLIMLLALKNAGLGDYAFSLDTRGEETVTTLCWQLSRIRREAIDELSDIIVADINNLPPFPENLTALQHLIDTRDVSFARIAEQVNIDPYLTADILKIVNSGAFMLNYRIDSIVEAIKFLGLKELKHLILTLGVQTILKNHDQNSEEHWRHSYKTAFYALQMAKALRLSPSKIDCVFSSAILHDIGKIPFSTLYPSLVAKLKHFCSCKSISNDIFEDVIGGINHSEIGYNMAQKWNFPTLFADVMRYHHHPGRAPEKYRDIACIVSLADALDNIEQGYLSQDMIDPYPLHFFEFPSAEEFLEAFSTLEKSFETENLMP